MVENTLAVTNGYRERRLLTSVGRVTLRIPKLRRGTYFPEDLIERYSRVDRAVVAAVAEMVAGGVSTRKVEKVARALGVDRMSASQVSRICESLDAAVADLQGRPLGGARFPYLWIDATYLKCRDGGHVPGCAVVTAIGAADTGRRVLLGADSADTEDYASWRAFLLSLRERGVAGVRCVTSDARAGLRRAIEEVFPGTPSVRSVTWRNGLYGRRQAIRICESNATDCANHPSWSPIRKRRNRCYLDAAILIYGTVNNLAQIESAAS